MEEEKRNTRKAVILVLITLGIIIFLSFYGITIVTKIIGLTSSFKKSGQTSNLTDNTPPAPPYLQTLPDSINKSPLEVTGHVEIGNTVVINFNGKEEELQTDENGNFSNKLDLVKGENNLFAYTKSPTGNISRQTDTSIIIFDNEAPQIKIDSPSDGANFYGTKQKTVNIKGTTEIDSSLTINDRIATVNDDGSFSFNYSLQAGENNLKIKSIDKAGNETETNLKLFFSE